MKDLFFAADLLTVFRHDTYYGDYKNISVALRKVGLAAVERTDSIEQMFHALVIHIMDQRGESEPFLAGTFIYPEAVIQLLNEHGLPAPATLQPASTTKNSSKESIDHAQFEQYFDIACRNCGTVTDPLATSYRTPLGRLIFRTFLETRLTLGINATGRYVLEHLTGFDTDKVVTSVNEDSVTWRDGESKEKITSVETIAKFVLNFNREIETLL
jgi:hypothetical protein